MNTLEQYADTIVGEILPQTFWDKVFQKQYRAKREAAKQKLYDKFENVAKSYHGIAVQNFEALLRGKCMDQAGKITRKVGMKDIEKAKPLFKP